MHIAHCSLSFWSHRSVVSRARSLPSLLAALIRAQARKAQGPIVFLRILLFYLFFYRLSGHFGGLNMVKNSWKCAHILEPAAVRTSLRLGPGTRAWHRGSTAPPGKPSENLMCSSHILARIHMKLGTHIDLIEPNNFCATCHGLRPTGSRLFRAV